MTYPFHNMYDQIESMEKKRQAMVDHIAQLIYDKAVVDYGVGEKYKDYYVENTEELAKEIVSLFLDEGK